MATATASEVLFFSDKSEASARVAKGLKDRGITYRTVWNAQCDLLPAIRVGDVRFESLADIQFYYFGQVDRARKLS